MLSEILHSSYLFDCLGTVKKRMGCTVSLWDLVRVINMLMMLRLLRLIVEIKVHVDFAID